jgi:phosphomannomutase
MHNFELEQARLDLDTTKESLRSFLVTSYTQSKYSKPEEVAAKTMKYLDSIIDKMIKKQAITVDFLHGASALWFSEVFKYFSTWIEQEVRVCSLLSAQINDNTDV